MKYKLNEEQKTLIQDAEKQCLSKYKIDNEDYIEIEKIFDVIDDLLMETSYLESKIDDLEHDEEGNAILNWI